MRVCDVILYGAFTGGEQRGRGALDGFVGPATRSAPGLRDLEWGWGGSRWAGGLRERRERSWGDLARPGWGLVLFHRVRTVGSLGRRAPRSRAGGSGISRCVSEFSSSTPHCEGVGEKVLALQESSERCCTTSHHFCYTNVRSPCWRDIWTRMQVREGGILSPSTPPATGLSPP